MLQDFQMARSQSDSGYNLAVGEPFFIQDALAEYMKVLYDGSMNYPLTDGQPALLQELSKLYPGKHIIVTHGAKYALQAAFYAHRELLNCQDVLHPVPYWPSYPTLAKLMGLSFNRNIASVTVNTSPNNPDGIENLEKCDIWDAAYSNSVLYGSTKIPEHVVGVYSASKMFGFSGLRVGWAVTADPELARLMSQYMEITTSGVSVASQSHVANFLRLRSTANAGEDIRKQLIEARATLATNAETFQIYIAPHCEVVSGLPKTGIGMFGWFKVKDPDKFKSALTKLEIKLVTGEACGMFLPGWYRINLGHRVRYTKDALQKLSSELNG